MRNAHKPNEWLALSVASIFLYKMPQWVARQPYLLQASPHILTAALNFCEITYLLDRASCVSDNEKAFNYGISRRSTRVSNKNSSAFEGFPKPSGLPISLPNLDKVIRFLSSALAVPQ